jgi:hypothetical protein
MQAVAAAADVVVVAIAAVEEMQFSSGVTMCATP